MKPLYYLFAFGILFCTSCRTLPQESWWETAKVDYIQVSSGEDYKRDSFIHVFFEGEMIDFEYHKLGLANTKHSRSSQDAVDQLKRKAFEVGGNALIHVRNYDKFSDHINDFPDVTERWSSIIVRVNKTDEFYERYGFSNDLGYFHQDEFYISKTNVNYLFYIIGFSTLAAMSYPFWADKSDLHK